MSKPAAIALSLAVLAGIILRLVYPLDIEYKHDERYSFDRAMHVGVDEPWPWLGMISSSNVKNPGMSVWVFVALARITGAHDPPSLARAVQLLNIIAILGLIVFIFRVLPPQEGEPWLWAVALVSLNPMAVLLHRKIWAQSVTPIFGLLVWIGWWRRDRAWGAILWGLAGAIIGQIHMSGFFFAAGVVLWTALFARQRTRWVYWFAASFAASLPLIPWANHVLHAPSIPARAWRLSQLPVLKFPAVWFVEALGIDQRWVLTGDYRDFLSSPLIAGHRTWLAAIMTAALGVAGVVVVLAAVAGVRRARRHWPELLADAQTPSAFALSSAFFGFGILASVLPFGFSRTYTLVTFPMVYLSLPAIILGWKSQNYRTYQRGLLSAICVAQLLLSATFVGFIHVNHGAPNGRYGTAYGNQSRFAEPLRETDE